MLKYILIGICFIIPVFMGLALASKQPSKHEWVCWANHDANQGTYGWSKSRKEAEKAAVKLCLEEWGPPCHIEYCSRGGR